MWSILWIIIIGFLVGVIARFVLPVPNKSTGFILTTMLGIVGAFLSTFIGQAVGLYRPNQGAGLIGSIAGALIVLFVWNRFVAHHVLRDPDVPGDIGFSLLMPITTLDITLSARSARHLYMTTAMGGFPSVIAGALWFIFFTTPLLDDAFTARDPAMTYYYKEHGLGFFHGAAFLTAIIAVTGALIYARRQLNGWAYVIAALCSALLLLILLFFLYIFFGETATDHDPSGETTDHDSSGAILTTLLFLFLASYMIRVLIDFARLTITRYDSLGATPLGVANYVSNVVLRRTRTSVPWLHRPTHPVWTSIYAILFFLSLPAGHLVWLFFLGGALPIVMAFTRPIAIVMAAALPIAMAAMARRHYSLTANRALELDIRKPVLFLRSFETDTTRLWGRGLLGKLRKRTIDEAISRLADRLGPFIAIANPTTALPRLGAAQSHYSNDTWQSAIAGWIAMSQVIVMIAGRTQGIRWELDHIFSNQAHRKLIIFFPPSLRLRENHGAAIKWLTDYFSHTTFAAELLSINLSRTIAIAFRDEGLVAVQTPRRIGRHEVDYYVALQTILCSINFLLGPALR
jgi:uncharacterized membrane protein YeaQ/YmgE (transglycosylase-associated protein family)